MSYAAKKHLNSWHKTMLWNTSCCDKHHLLSLSPKQSTMDSHGTGSSKHHSSLLSSKKSTMELRSNKSSPKNLRWNYAATKAAVTNIIHLRYLPKIRQQIRTFACWATTNTIRHHNHPNSWQIHAMVGMAAKKAKIIRRQDLRNPPHHAVAVASSAAVTTTWMLLWLPVHHNVGITPSCHDAINDGQCFLISCWFPTWIPFSVDMSSAAGEMDTAALFRVDLGINSINSNHFKVWNWSLYLRQDGICCQKWEKY